MILAADLGTSSLKAALLRDDGTLYSRCRVPYPGVPVADDPNFLASWWMDAFQKALKHLDPTPVTAVALSGNGPTLVACDSSGQALAPVDLWLQNRSIRLEDQPSYYLPKAAWLKSHDHGTWSRTAMLLSCPEWLQYHLTHRAVGVTPHDSFRPFLWDKDQIDAYGLNAELFPEILTMGDIAGTVTAQAAARTGLNAGIPVVAVGSDFMAALLGSGAIEPGAVCDRAGTSEGLNYCCHAPSGDSRLRDLPHAVEPYWNAAAILSSTGAVFEWYRRLTGQTDRPYEETLEDAAALPMGCPLPTFYPGARGDVLWEFGGGSFHNLEPRHGPAEMGRAVMEAIAFAVRRGVEILEEANLPVTDMRVCGGQARGRVWNQMKADVTGKRLLIPHIEDAELAGGLCCATVALNRFPDVETASRELVRIRATVEPRDAVHRRYDELYREYRNGRP